MKSFYWNLWIEGKSRIEALRQAQLTMLRKQRIENDGHALPFYWGAFVLSGEWR